MKITISKTQEEQIEVSCPIPKYMKYGNDLFFKFHEQDGIILTTKFSRCTGNYPFDMNVCKNLNLDMFDMVDDIANEITEQEYYTAFWEQLSIHKVVTIPNNNEGGLMEAPTLHRQNEIQ